MDKIKPLVTLTNMTNENVTAQSIPSNFDCSQISTNSDICFNDP